MTFTSPPPQGGQLLVKIGDGADPEVFAHDCLINTEKSLQFSSDRNDFTVPDCTDFTKPGWKHGIIDGLQAAVNGSGKLYTKSVQDWFDWFKSGAVKNIRVEIVVSAAEGGGYFEFPATLDSFDITGPDKNVCTSSVALSSSGEVNWVPAV